VSAIASLPFKVAHRLNKIRAQARNPTRSVDYAGRTPSIDRALFDVPSHSITTDAAWFMHDYVVEHGLRLGLEIGSKFGWSGMWLSRALAANGGELVQADLKLRARLGANYRVAGVANATIVLGDSSSAEVAAAVGGVLRGRALDFAFIDGDHSYEACLADYRLVERYSGPETHVFFDNMWECGGVLRVFEEQPADEKLIVTGLRADAPGRSHEECLGVHVLRNRSPDTAPPVELVPAPWGAYLVTASGKVEHGAPWSGG
jgi:hypothetical protein